MATSCMLSHISNSMHSLTMTMTMKMCSLRLLAASAILVSYSTHPTTNAFLTPTPSLNSPNSIRLTSDVSSSNYKKAFRSSSPSSSLLKAYYDDDDEEGYEIESSGGSKTQQLSTSFGAENVPVDQRPSNEYLNLISQPLFGWASQEIGDQGLGIRLAVTYAAFFAVVCYPIAGATFVNEGFLIQKLASSNVGALTVVFLLILRLYSGWGYIGSRLKSKVIEFEETGWYDGDIEEKSEAEKARDLFLYRSNVQPVEERLKKFSLTVGGAWVASCLALNVATNMQPVFDQYDPRMLEKLSYDDKVASVVQQQSYGRPTYCESRYYRAVANGGQGCN